MFIWIEGGDDERFFKHILQPKLQSEYDFVETIGYATMKQEKVDDYLKSIKAMNADYIFVTDINDAPCVTAKKHETQNNLRNVNGDRIVVVIKEIESWYLAGLGSDQAGELGIQVPSSTDEIAKEQFDRLMPRRFDSRIDFMLEILKHFSIEVAKRKNKSFSYCFEKYDCEASGNISWQR